MEGGRREKKGGKRERKGGRQAGRHAYWDALREEKTP